MDNESINHKTIRAFILTLARQDQPTPALLQTQLHEIGQKIQQELTILDQPIIDLIKPLLDSHPTLATAYQSIRAELSHNNQERTKGGPIDFYSEASTAEITNVFKTVVQSTDSICCAQEATQKTKPNWFQKILGK